MQRQRQSRSNRETIRNRRDRERIEETVDKEVSD